MISKPVADLLAALPPDVDFPGLIAALHRLRFTGPVTFNFLNGHPRQIDLGQPVKLSICAGERGGQAADPQKGLDTAGRVRTG